MMQSVSRNCCFVNSLRSRWTPILSASRGVINRTELSFHSSAAAWSSQKITTQWADPAMQQYKFWNREESTEKGKYSYLLEISPESMKREAKILSLSGPDDDANTALHKGSLPMGAKLLGIGESLQDFDSYRDSKPNVLFVSPSCPRAMVQLPLVLAAFPTIEWVHVRSAGIDFVVCDELTEFRQKVQVTNAKGQFSSSLAEYVMMACSYFAKDLPRLMKQQQAKNWEKYDIEELRGKTMGIVGYGDIGRSCAKLATVYGMRVVALRRRPYLSKRDPLLDAVYGTDKASLNELMSVSDYIVCSAPSTVETRGMVNADAFTHVKENAVFINLGRGPVVDESALIKALQSGRLKGAALDVFQEEPLPLDNPLWDLDNVMISPHNMDQTSTFMHEATEFFVNENLPRFICGEELLNPVDIEAGY
ncbi:2-hydroxyacid dehydrogenase [Nitzschia inconspicua]|uniref:2-hydroxyacid dehydrogenase n=1 Tax=Nitzschia inconspicua TaxID=303405 RepID=A0A9K3PPS0_9STRA|nr:2-hydroxyacid dehydrogenase [Nitzschia inconspicua]KAG7359017.1 2-hydroxyacid dehydrogenase [Nitzschia inconspicua]